MKTLLAPFRRLVVFTSVIGLLLGAGFALTQQEAQATSAAFVCHYEDCGSFSSGYCTQWEGNDCENNNDCI